MLPLLDAVRVAAGRRVRRGELAGSVAQGGAAFALAILLAACASTPRQNDRLTPAPGQRPDLDHAIVTARAGFTRAAEAGDAHAMGLAFTADATLISARSDTIRGREAIADYFATRSPAVTGATFRFARFPPLNPCTDGAVERGEYWADVWHRGGTADTVTGAFTARWARDSLGAVTIRWIALADRSPAVAPPRQLPCADPAVRFQVSTRLAVTLIPVAWMDNGATPDIEAAMITQAWHDRAGDCSNCTTSHPTPVSQVLGRTGPFVPALAALSYRFSDALAGEVMIGALPQGSTVGRNDTRMENLTVSWSGQVAGLVLSYHRAAWQLGAGPAVQRVRWEVQVSPPFYSPPSYQATSRASVVGLVADLGFHHALIERVRFDGRVQLRAFGKTTPPSAPNFTPPQAQCRSSLIGAGVGIVF